MDDQRQHSPSVARNRNALLSVLQTRLNDGVRVLEVGSGSGEHAVYIGEAMPAVAWLPSDPDASARASISAWIHASEVPNVAAPLDIDVRRLGWADAVPKVDAVVSINMIHITPPSTVDGLMSGASELLKRRGRVFLYGPFRQSDKPTASSNEDFDRWLKERDPTFGLRELGEVEAVANERGLLLAEVIEMPANNLTVVFRREG